LPNRRTGNARTLPCTRSVPGFREASGTLKPRRGAAYSDLYPVYPVSSDTPHLEFYARIAASRAALGIEPFSRGVVSPLFLQLFPKTGYTMPNTAERLDRPSLESSAPTPEPPGFEFPNDEEREIFEDICDYIAERAAILEYEEGFTRRAAEEHAELRAMERYPPSPTARAAILDCAQRMAAYYGFPDWSTPRRWHESKIRRFHVNHGYWLDLREYFERKRATGDGRKRDISG
jgi:hypothetical protein